MCSIHEIAQLCVAVGRRPAETWVGFDNNWFSLGLRDITALQCVWKATIWTWDKVIFIWDSDKKKASLKS